MKRTRNWPGVGQKKETDAHQKALQSTKTTTTHSTPHRNNIETIMPRQHPEDTPPRNNPKTKPLWNRDMPTEINRKGNSPISDQTLQDLATSTTLRDHQQITTSRRAPQGKMPAT